MCSLLNEPFSESFLLGEWSSFSIRHSRILWLSLQSIIHNYLNAFSALWNPLERNEGNRFQSANEVGDMLPKANYLLHLHECNMNWIFNICVLKWLMRNRHYIHYKESVKVCTTIFLENTFNRKLGDSWKSLRSSLLCFLTQT